jgi:hypothetical protein
MEATIELKSIPDDELLRRLADMLRQSRHVEADLVAHIGEVDRRRLYASTASPSMFAYATEVLRLSDAEAYLRIAAARASREHPILLAMLADGRLHLTAIVKLAPHLTPENRETLLARAVHRGKREIEQLVAELAPRPDVPALMRRLPDPGGRGSAPSLRFGSGEGTASRELRLEGVAAEDAGSRSREVAKLPPNSAPPKPAELGPDGVARRGAEFHPGGVATAEVVLRPDGVAPRCAELRPMGVAGIPARQQRPAVVAPLAPGRYKVQFTASAELHEKLERLRGLMRASVPDGDLAAIIDRAVTEKLARLEARRFAQTRKPRKVLSETDTSPRTRQIPAAVKRAVYQRDGGRCRYVDGQGRRCTGRERLEFHHRHPFGLGGDHSVENIALACRRHNGVIAEIDYGPSVMALHRGSPKRFAERVTSTSP